MSQNVISRSRDAQRALTETLVVPLWAHIGQIIAVEPTRLKEFIEPIVAADGTELDPDAVRISYEREVEHHVAKAIDGYIAWVAARIIRSDDFEPQDLPVPSIVDVLSITSAYDVKPAILSFVVERLREDTAVPLLGRIDGGTLFPDEAALKEWAAFFDWSDTLTL